MIPCTSSYPLPVPADAQASDLVHFSAVISVQIESPPIETDHDRWQYRNGYGTGEGIHSCMKDRGNMNLCIFSRSLRERTSQLDVRGQGLLSCPTATRLKQEFEVGPGVNVQMPGVPH